MGAAGAGDGSRGCGGCCGRRGYRPEADRTTRLEVEWTRVEARGWGSTTLERRGWRATVGRVWEEGKEDKARRR